MLNANDFPFNDTLETTELCVLFFLSLSRSYLARLQSRIHSQSNHWAFFVCKIINIQHTIHVAHVFFLLQSCRRRRLIEFRLTLFFISLRAKWLNSPLKIGCWVECATILLKLRVQLTRFVIESSVWMQSEKKLSINQPKHGFCRGKNLFLILVSNTSTFCFFLLTL